MNRLRKTGRILAALMCFILTAAAITSCSSGSSGSKDRNSDSYQHKLETDTVRLAYAPNGHIFNIIAENQGFLAEEGLTVEYVMAENDEEVFKGIQSGTIDIASNSGTNLPLQQLADGLELTFFAGYAMTGCMPIFAKVDTKWESIDDLIGKTVAFEPNLYAITGPLADKGYYPVSQITWYDTDDQLDRIKAVKEGKADFGLVGTAYNYEINYDPELKVCTYAADVLPDYSCCRVEARSDWVTEHPETIKALLRAWIRAMEYYESHHDETVGQIVEITGQDEEHVRAYMDNPRFSLKTDPLKTSIVRAWEYLNKLGLLSATARQIDIEKHINTNLYKQALDECQARYGAQNPDFYEKLQAQYARFNLLEME